MFAATPTGGDGLDAGESAHHPALLNFYLYYGDNFKIECPTGSAN